MYKCVLVASHYAWIEDLERKKIKKIRRYTQKKKLDAWSKYCLNIILVMVAENQVLSLEFVFFWFSRVYLYLCISIY